MKIGNITCQTDEFTRGYQAGQDRFKTHYKKHLPIADMQVYSFIAAHIYQVTHSNTYNAGYILGWCDALAARPSQMFALVEVEP